MPPNDSVTSFRVRTAGAKAGARSQRQPMARRRGRDRPSGLDEGVGAAESAATGTACAPGVVGTGKSAALPGALPIRPRRAGAACRARARGPGAAPAGRSTRPLPGNAGSRRGPDSTPISLSLTIFSAICSGVPIRPVLKPSLYCTRSSKFELAHMPCLSGDDLPACFTASPKPCTASTSAFAMISRSTSWASRSVSRAMMNALAPNRRRRPLAAAAGRSSSICALWPASVLPFMKYQSDTRAAIARAAVELPPWKISGCG